SVGAERQRPAVMVGCAAEVVELENHDFASDYGDVTVCGEPADAIVYSWRRRRVIDVDEMVRRKIWIECHAEQTSLAIGVDGHRHKWCRKQRSIFHDPQAAGLFADK